MKNLIIIISTIIILSFFAYASFYPSSQIFGKIIYKNPDDHILLTFDDGPGEDTEAILNVLKEYNEKAIFFIVGNHIQPGEEEIIKRIVAEGHEVGVHGTTHKFLWRNSYEEIKVTKQILENLTGEEVKYFRPPYGFRFPGTIKAAEKLNLKTMTWSLFTFDYKANNPDKITNRIEKRLQKKDIICLHDGPKNKQPTVQALPKIIDIIRAKE